MKKLVCESISEFKGDIPENIVNLLLDIANSIQSSLGLAGSPIEEMGYNENAESYFVRIPDPDEQITFVHVEDLWNDVLERDYNHLVSNVWMDYNTANSFIEVFINPV